MTHTPLGPGPEFDLVRELVARYGASAIGIGDDASPVQVPAGEQLFVSTDVAVEDVHFRASWLTADEIGYRSTMAALSDLAAMAVMPRGIVIALTLPSSWRAKATAIADGIARAARACNAPIIGGDLSDGPALSLAITVLGSSRTPLRRSGARVGDAVWVTGRLGGPATALASFLAGGQPLGETRARFAAPQARIRESVWLAAHSATACIDISDGLAADLGHVAAASGVRIALDLDRILCLPGVSGADAAGSAEEYEIVVTGAAALDVAAFEAEFNIPLTQVGSVIAGAAGVEAHSAGAAVAVPPGFNHFAR